MSNDVIGWGYSGRPIVQLLFRAQGQLWKFTIYCYFYILLMIPIRSVEIWVVFHGYGGENTMACMVFWRKFLDDSFNFNRKRLYERLHVCSDFSILSLVSRFRFRFFRKLNGQPENVSGRFRENFQPLKTKMKPESLWKSPVEIPESELEPPNFHESGASEVSEFSRFRFLGRFHKGLFRFNRKYFFKFKNFYSFLDSCWGHLLFSNPNIFFFSSL